MLISFLNKCWNLTKLVHWKGNWISIRNTRCHGNQTSFDKAGIYLKKNLENYSYGATFRNASMPSYVGLYHWCFVMHQVLGSLISSFWYFGLCGLRSLLEGLILYHAGGISTRHCSSWKQKGECQSFCRTGESMHSQVVRNVMLWWNMLRSCI